MGTPVEASALIKAAGWIKTIWLRLWTYGKQIATLEERVAVLEHALTRQPGDKCPYCGERAMRLKQQHHIKGEPGKQTTDEDWQCEKCTKTYNKREPIWIRRP
jgi:uncharacterized protein with PIN domain